VRRWVRDLNRLYRTTAALHQRDFAPEGFEWVDCDNADDSVIVYLRRGVDPHEVALIACNFTPVPREHYRVGVPIGGTWTERLNSDAQEYGGSGIGNLGSTEAEPQSSHGRPYSLALRLPPLAVLVLTPG
jgi:1,4-alpha-glucan branching enzyme